MDDLIGVLVAVIALASVMLVPVVALLCGMLALGLVGWLHARVRDLEAEVARLRAGAPVAVPEAHRAAAPAPADVAEPSDVPEVDAISEDAPTDAAPTPPATPPRAPSKPRPPPFQLPSAERVAVWVASGLGGFLVLLGALFALAVAFERGLLGPSTRISLGLISGTAMWSIGTLLRARRYRLFGSAVGGAGLGIVYGSLFAATGTYDLLPDLAGFACLVAVSAVALGVASRFRDRFLAHLGLIGALLTPVLVSSGENNPAGLFAYLAVVLAGTQATAVRRRWPDLTALGALGALSLYVGWTVTWYAPDQVPAAVLGALALTVPFAVGAGWSGPNTLPVRLVSGLAAVLVGVAALPWMGPLDPMFEDPRSGLAVVRALHGGHWWAVVGLALLPLPLWLAAARRKDPAASVAGTSVAMLLLAGFAITWAVHPTPPVTALVIGSVAALAVSLVHAGRDPAGWGALPVPLGAGWAVAVWVGVVAPPGPPVAVAISAVAVLGALLALVSGIRHTLLATLAGVAMALYVATARVDDIGASGVAAPAVLAYAVLATLPVLLSRRGSTAPALTAALAGPALFVPLYRAWDLGLGDAAIGLLPLLLGANALLAAVVLLRRFRATSGDATLAAFVGVALLGVSAALPVQLHNQWLTVAWAVEVAALAALANRLTHPLLRASAVVLALVVAVRLLINPYALAYGDTSGWPVLNWTLYTWGVPAIALLLAAWWYPATSGWERPVPTVLRVLGIFVGFALANVQVSDLFQHAGPVELGGVGVLQGMVRSVSWGAFGMVVLIAGLAAGSRPIRLVGFALVLLAAGKVFVVDLWSLSGFVRVGSVLGLGVCLLVAALLFERLVLRGGDAKPAEETS